MMINPEHFKINHFIPNMETKISVHRRKRQIRYLPTTEINFALFVNDIRKNNISKYDI